MAGPSQVRVNREELVDQRVVVPVDGVGQSRRVAAGALEDERRNLGVRGDRLGAEERVVRELKGRAFGAEYALDPGLARREEDRRRAR